MYSKESLPNIFIKVIDLVHAHSAIQQIQTKSNFITKQKQDGINIKFSQLRKVKQQAKNEIRISEFQAQKTKKM